MKVTPGGGGTGPRQSEPPRRLPRPPGCVPDRGGARRHRESGPWVRSPRSAGATTHSTPGGAARGLPGLPVLLRPTGTPPLRMGAVAAARRSPGAVGRALGQAPQVESRRRAGRDPGQDVLRLDGRRLRRPPPGCWAARPAVGADRRRRPGWPGASYQADRRTSPGWSRGCGPFGGCQVPGAGAASDWRCGRRQLGDDGLWLGSPAIAAPVPLIASVMRRGRPAG